MHGAITPLTNTPSWSDAQLQKSQGQIILGIIRGNGGTREQYEYRKNPITQLMSSAKRI
jgi:hypothetical protein